MSGGTRVSGADKAQAILEAVAYVGCIITAWAVGLISGYFIHG